MRESARLPQRQQRHEAEDRRERREDVGEIRPDESRDQDTAWRRNRRPHTSAAGHTARSAFHPPITIIRYAGMNSDTGAQILPTSALSVASGSFVTPASVTSGVPMAPNATGAVFAIRQIAAA